MPPATPPRPLELRTLGACALVAPAFGDRPEQRLLGAGKPLALLAYCAAHADTVLPRRQLVDMLWADTPADRRRQNVRQVIYRLRMLGDEVLETPDDEHVRIGSGISADRTRLLQAVDREDLDAVLAVYQGPYLPELAIPGGDEFEDWATEERDRLERLVLHVAHTQLLREAEAGRELRVRDLLDRVVRVVRPGPRADVLGIEVSLAIGDGRTAQRVANQLAAVVSTETQGLDVGPLRALINRARSWQPPNESAATVPVLDMIGREAPFAHIVSAMRRVAQGSAEVVVVGGVAGIGKTRILDAVAARSRSRAGATVLVRATPAGRTVPFGVAGEVASAFAGLPGAAGIHAESARELVALDPRLASTYRVAPATTEGGEAIRRRALALFDLLEATAEQQPITLLLDDLHWCDPLSRQVLEAAIAKADTMPLLVVGSARGVVTDWLPHPRVQREILLPLSRSDSLEALRSSGAWPEHEGAEQFLQALADSAGGVPHGLTERLALAMDRGLLSRQRDRWQAADWAEATALVSVSSPLDHRLVSCAREERIFLLHLALQGGAIASDVALRSLAPMDIVADSVGRALEARGLIVTVDGAWQSTHDLVAERMLALTTAEEQRRAHVALTEALAASGTSDALTAALRQAVAGGLDDLAIQTFRQQVERRRAAGDRRTAEDILSEAVGVEIGQHRRASLVRALPWRVRSPHARRWATGVVLGAGLGLLVLLQWWIQRRPALAISGANGVFTVAYVYGTDVRRMSPSLAIQSLATNPAGRTIRAELVAPKGTDSILAGETALTDRRGIATFVGLRIRTLDTMVTLRFTSPGHEDAQTSLRLRLGFNELNRLQLYGGNLAGRPIRGLRDSLVVVPGERLQGVVQLRYATGWVTASIWVSVVPTWGDPSTSFREPEQLVTPVSDDVADVPVDLTAPMRAGRYWILFAMDAEDRGGYIASGTNWLVGKALWNDGNDLWSLPDSTIEQARITGTYPLRRAYPAEWYQNQCDQPSRMVNGQRIKYCPGKAWLAPLRVIVRAPDAPRAPARPPGSTRPDTSRPAPR
jgi:DNA-binding SARP family transcriptional activator